MGIARIFNKPLRAVYLAGFLFSIHIAFTIYINSTFLESVVNKEVVGILYTAGSLFAIFGLMLLPRVMNIIGSKLTLTFALLASIGSLLGIIMTHDHVLTPIFFVIYFGMNTLILFGIDLFVENYTDNEATGDTRGKYLTVNNVAIMVTPFAAGIIADRFGFPVVYAVAAGFVVCVLVLVSRRLKFFADPKYESLSFWKTFATFMRDRNLKRIFIANFLLQFFYSWMVIYIPIYLVQTIGMEWEFVGIIMTIALSAFVIFQYPLGRIADRFIGEKEILTTGFLIAAGAAITIAFVDSTTWWVWAIILFVSRMGASAIEIMTESYFFKKADAKDVSAISMFRNTHPLAYIIGPLLATLFLTGVPINMLFLILGFIMLYGLRYSVPLLDTK